MCVCVCVCVCVHAHAHILNFWERDYMVNKWNGDRFSDWIFFQVNESVFSS